MIPETHHANCSPNLKYLDYLSRNPGHPDTESAMRLFDEYIVQKGPAMTVQQCNWLLSIAKRMGMRGAHTYTHLCRFLIPPCVVSCRFLSGASEVYEESWQLVSAGHGNAADTWRQSEPIWGSGTMHNTRDLTISTISAGEHERAVKLMERVVQMGMVPSAATYNIAISACTSVDQVCVFVFVCVYVYVCVLGSGYAVRCPGVFS